MMEIYANTSQAHPEPLVGKGSGFTHMNPDPSPALSVHTEGGGRLISSINSASWGRLWDHLHSMQNRLRDPSCLFPNLLMFFPYLQALTRVKPFICTMPLKLEEGWNNIQLNLADLTRRAYGTNYVETLRVQVHANCRLRRIYFSDRLYSEEELPPEFKLYLPMPQVPTPAPSFIYKNDSFIRRLKNPSAFLLCCRSPEFPNIEISSGCVFSRETVGFWVMRWSLLVKILMLLQA